MIISHFRQIRSAYHPEFGESMVGDKCHQLRFLIRCIIRAAERNFGLGQNSGFDEWDIATCSRFWCVRKYNKDKPEKSIIYFFVLTGRKYYFVWKIGIYLWKNAGKIDIYHRAKQLTTTMKAVINDFLDSNIANDNYGAWKIFLEKRYACPELFSIIFEDMNLVGGGTCRNNIIGFPGNYERLKFPKGAVRGTYRQIYNRVFHILSTR